MTIEKKKKIVVDEKSAMCDKSVIYKSELKNELIFRG